jgi:hypothetical protein
VPPVFWPEPELPVKAEPTELIIIALRLLQIWRAYGFRSVANLLTETPAI